jgi:hypothetical protein
MKKTIFCVMVFFCFCAVAIFAQEQFTVLAVTGKVERETEGGVWVGVKVNDSLDGQTTVRTGAGATLTVGNGGRRFVIGALKRGKTGVLAGTGVRVGGMVNTGTAAPETARNTRTIPTAATRADEQEQEDSYSEE